MSERINARAVIIRVVFPSGLPNRLTGAVWRRLRRRFHTLN